MRTLTQAELLSLWETGRRLSSLDRAVLMAGAVAGSGRGDPADWPLGVRNYALAQLHRIHFGDSIRGYTRCRQCGAQLEFEFDLTAMENEDTTPIQQLVSVGKWKFRLPTSRVLAVAASAASESAAARRLVGECCAETEAANPEWTDSELVAIEEQLAAADPLAEIRLHFDCPACAASFDESLDLPIFVWAEVEAAARRVLAEIHALASVYGWTEAQILSLSPMRRATYLEMVQT